MAIVNVNYLAVLVAAIANMAVGFIWYSPAVFGRKWAALIGKTETEMKESMKKEMTMTYLWSFVAALVTAYVLAHFAQSVGTIDYVDAVQLGFWIWLGFVATSGLSSVLYERKPQALYYINTLYYLVSYVVMAWILSVWR